MAEQVNRNRRKVRTGTVTSSAMNKSIVVRIDSTSQHPLYKKILRTFSKLHAHDEKNEAGVGDLVKVMETRPLSKTKHWRLIEIVEKAR